MKTYWTDFLNTQQAIVTDDLNVIFPQSTDTIDDTLTTLIHLSLLKVTGLEATQFLQGQLSCNINDLTENNSFFTAYCNAKGRTLTTLLIVKTEADYLLILPTELIEKISQKLKMYIMRADVQLNNISDSYRLIGLQSQQATTSYPQTIFQQAKTPEITLNIPTQNRYLIIVANEQFTEKWQQLMNDYDLKASSSNYWRYQDLSAGLAWLTPQTSEQYIPQMLNMDTWKGAINFKKGCYIGQEIIARTHYLGKAKRQLFIAESNQPIQVDTQNHTITTDNDQISGNILNSQSNSKHTRLQLILPTEAQETKNLTIHNTNQDKIRLI